MEGRTIRPSLEGLTAGLAACNASEEDAERLAWIQDLYESVDHAGDAEQAFRFNRDFHFGVYRLSRMDTLVAHIKSLWISMGPMLTVFFSEGEHRYIGGSEHRNIIAALRERNFGKARSAMKR